MTEIIWNGFLILIVLAIVGLSIGGSWSTPTPSGSATDVGAECHHQ